MRIPTKLVPRTPTPRTPDLHKHHPTPHHLWKSGLKKIIRTLRAVHTATIEVNGQRLTLDQAPNDTANAILTALETGH